MQQLHLPGDVAAAPRPLACNQGRDFSLESWKKEEHALFALPTVRFCLQSWLVLDVVWEAVALLPRPFSV